MKIETKKQDTTKESAKRVTTNATNARPTRHKHQGPSAGIPLSRPNIPGASAFRGQPTRMLPQHAGWLCWSGPPLRLPSVGEAAEGNHGEKTPFGCGKPPWRVRQFEASPICGRATWLVCLSFFLKPCSGGYPILDDMSCTEHAIP